MAENDATHTVRLWLANSEGDYRHWTERAQALYDATDTDETHGYRINETQQALSDEMRYALEEIPDGLTGMYADLLRGALDMVDWYDVAEQFVEEIEPATPTEEG